VSTNPSAFRPIVGSTISITGNTSAAIAIPNAPTVGYYQVRVRNKGNTDIYCAFGNSTVTVTIPTGAAGNTPGNVGFSGNSIEVMTVNSAFVAVAGPAGTTANAEFTTGYGY
jgi:hypothetical protein